MVPVAVSADARRVTASAVVVHLAITVHLAVRAPLVVAALVAVAAETAAVVVLALVDLPAVAAPLAVTVDRERMAIQDAKTIVEIMVRRVTLATTIISLVAIPILTTAVPAAVRMRSPSLRM